MTERAPQTPENAAEISAEHRKKQHESLNRTIEHGKKARHEHAENIDAIREAAERQSKSAAEVSHTSEDSSEHERPAYVNRELKAMAYRRTLKRTQQQLSAPSRVLSKIVHQPTIEAVSDFASGTVARPSGILAGGITAFVGSSLFLWVARHYGYEYNFLLFALLFVAGFFIGLLVELGLRLAAHRSR